MISLTNHTNHSTNVKVGKCLLHLENYPKILFHSASLKQNLKWLLCSCHLRIFSRVMPWRLTECCVVTLELLDIIILWVFFIGNNCSQTRFQFKLNLIPNYNLLILINVVSSAYRLCRC